MNQRDLGSNRGKPVELDVPRAESTCNVYWWFRFRSYRLWGDAITWVRQELEARIALCDQSITWLWGFATVTNSPSVELDDELVEHITV